MLNIKSVKVHHKEYYFTGTQSFMLFTLQSQRNELQQSNLLQYAGLVSNDLTPEATRKSPLLR